MSKQVKCGIKPSLISMIRPYSPKDKNALISLIRLNTPQYFDASEEAGFISYLDNEIETYFVFEQEGKILGCGGINYELKSNTGYISWDIIHPRFQGKGIGKKLLLHRIAEIKKSPSIKIIVVRTSQHTANFYAKGGFKLDFVTKNYWAKGFDLYQMKIHL